MAKNIKKQLVFSKELLDLAEHKARKFGISFGEYLRLLIINDSEKGVDYEYHTTPEEEDSIKKSLEDYAAGRYKILKTDKDIHEFMENQNNEL